MRRTIVVTGSSRGLGLKLCQLLVEQGDKVVGVSRQVSREFQQLAERVNEHQRELVVHEPFDLSQTSIIPEFAQGLIAKYGPLYGLVNNAGVGADGILATMHNSQIELALKINLEAPVLLTKYISRSMLRGGVGRVVNISSVIASTGYNGLAAYAATKAGLEGFTRSLSRELGRRNITVNCVAPGFMTTDMTSKLEGEKMNSILRRSPLGLAETGDAANAVIYLLSDVASKITGTVITVDGGGSA